MKIHQQKSMGVDKRRRIRRRCSHRESNPRPTAPEQKLDLASPQRQGTETARQRVAKHPYRPRTARPSAVVEKNRPSNWHK